jgi:hypothetical protein
MLTLTANAEFSTAFPQGAGWRLSPQQGAGVRKGGLMGLLDKVFRAGYMLKSQS